MEKYSVEWKMKKRKWLQYSKTYGWVLHYIHNDVEYSKGQYFTKVEAEKALGEFEGGDK